MKSKFKYIWNPKNLNNMDKNAYIASYVHEYVIQAIMFILTDGNQIQIGFGFLKVNILIKL